MVWWVILVVGGWLDKLTLEVFSTLNYSVLQDHHVKREQERALSCFASQVFHPEGA